MTGFEPHISGIGSDRSTNCPTTPAQSLSCRKAFVRIEGMDEMNNFS